MSATTSAIESVLVGKTECFRQPTQWSKLRASPGMAGYEPSQCKEAEADFEGFWAKQARANAVDQAFHPHAG